MIMRDPGASSRRVVAEALEAAGLSVVPPLAEIGSTAAAITTASAGGVPVLLSALALERPGDDELVALRIAGMRLERRFVLVHSGEESLPAAARTLLHDLVAAAELARG